MAGALAPWTRHLKHRVVALAASPRRVAALDVRGWLHLVTARGALRRARPLPSGPQGDDDAAPELPDQIAWGEGAWLASTPADDALLRVAGGQIRRVGKGTSAIVAWAARGPRLLTVRSDRATLFERGRLAWSTTLSGWFEACAITSDAVTLVGQDEIARCALEDGARLDVVPCVRQGRGPTPLTVAGSRVVVGAGDSLLFVAGAAEGGAAGPVVRRVPLPAAATSLSADGDAVVVGLADGALHVIDAATAEVRGRARVGPGAIVAVALGRDQIVASTRRGVLAGLSRADLLGVAPASAPAAALFSRGGRVVVGDRAGRVRVLDGEREAASFEVGEAPLGVHESRGGSRTVAASPTRLAILDAADGALRTVALRRRARSFTADDAYAYTGTGDGALEAYDLSTGDRAFALAVAEEPIVALARVPGGSLLVVGIGGIDARVAIVDVTRGEVVRTFQPQADAFAVSCVAAHPGGRAVAVGSDDCALTLVDLEGRVRRRLELPDAPVALAFEPHGAALLVACANGAAVVVTLPSGPDLAVLQLAARATRVAWGAVPVVACDDGRIVVA